MEVLVSFALAAFFPRDGDLPGLAELGLDEKVAKLRRESTTLFWAGLVGAALFFQLAPILTLKLPIPAALLSPEQLDLHAQRIASSRVYAIRQILVLLKLVGGVFWGQSPEIRAFLALPPYGDDPGTRRTEPIVGVAPLRDRAPREALVALGRREAERGRSVTPLARKHGIEVA
ncbi:MAG TPA: hypothetical protein VHB21_00140 [Minicystis sp.]|nr:hypothetical protein [Minicystis sp.]